MVPTSSEPPASESSQASSLPFLLLSLIAERGGRAVRLDPVEEWRNDVRSGELRKK
jgi:hypothetical protein